MNKDLHDMDGLFRSALHEYEESPSSDVKERLDAALDKKISEPYKKRSFSWKRATLLLLLLLTGFVLYESGILKKEYGSSGGRTADKQMNYPSGIKPKKTYQNNNTTGNTNNQEPASYNNEASKNNIDNTIKTMTGDDKIIIQPKQKDITVPVAGEINNKTGSNKSLTGNQLVLQNNNPERQENTDKTINNFLKPRILLPKEKTNLIEFLREVNITKLADGLVNSKKQLQSVNESLLKISRPNFFKPFWMITAFASYERAGYRLDSDLPTNITNIKYSEVHEPSFSLGILTTRQLKKQWGIQTGLIYYQTDIGISPQKLFSLQDPGGDITFKYITSSGYAYIKPGLGAPPAIGDSLTTTQGKHSLKFISVPLAVKYSVRKNKFTFTPGAGIEANFLTSAKVETEVESPSNPEIIFINKLDGAKPFYLSVVADAELRYKLNNKLSVSFRPAIRFATSPATKNNVVETFPRSVGVGMGLTWKF